LLEGFIHDVLRHWACAEYTGRKVSPSMLTLARSLCLPLVKGGLSGQDRGRAYA